MEERALVSSKERKQHEFFSAMESNILKCLAHGSVPGMSSPTKQAEDELGPKVNLTKSTNLSKPSTISVRTISAMNENVLQELVQMDTASPTHVIDVPDSSSQSAARSNKFSFGNDDGYESSELDFDFEEDDMLQAWVRNGSNPSLTDPTEFSHDAFEFNESWEPNEFHYANKHDALAEVKRVADAMKKERFPTIFQKGEKAKDETNLQKPSLGPRRNTCGTLYLGATMSAPDKEATIKVSHEYTYHHSFVKKKFQTLS